MYIKFLLLIITTLTSIIIPNIYNYNLINYNNNECINIHYGGFSGFWYYYGYLQKNYILDKKIYCYSSGCLSVIASIQHNNNNSIFNYVQQLNYHYQNNKINKYIIKQKFINHISNKVINIKNYDINIITSNLFGQCFITKPNNLTQLITALDETTNLPILTTHFSYQKKLDGYFCLTLNYICKKNIKLPYNLYLYKNIFNPNITFSDINYYINLS